MGTRQNSHPLEDNPLIEDVFGSMDSPDDALSDAQVGRAHSRGRP